MGSIYKRMNNIMDCMLQIYNKLKKESFSISGDVQFDVLIKKVKVFTGLNDNEAALFIYAFVVYFDYNQKPISFAMMANDASINPIVMLSFTDEFAALEEKGFLYSDTSEDVQSNAKFYRVPDGVVKAILKNDKQLLKKGLKTRTKDLTYPDEIKEKNLFYMEGIAGEIKRLTEYLTLGKLEAIQDRLAERSMSRGVCIMLYGESGTGKTETVFQIARKTGRSIFHVDIGSTISCWHGGTERNLSNLFEKYKRLCRQSVTRGEQIPIMLFNEADALFGRRLERPTQGAEIDENKIQSVLLDYLEKQEGIIIVTTNLPGNFDKAFERRFLYKIKFENPSLEIKQKIWKDKISWLNKQAVEKLASSYAFSGAEIDNVVRKATMNEVLTGKRSSVSELEGYCQKEKLEKEKNSRIGFMNK